MDTLIRKSWLVYDRFKNEEFVLAPSIPILYFGDGEGYFESKTKVITVGLNPSRIEFLENDRYSRFAKAQGIYPQILNGDYYQEYLEALNGYFSNNPYRMCNNLLPVREVMARRS